MHGIPDPQLHSHIMMLAAERQDGKLPPIETRQIIEGRPGERRVVQQPAGRELPGARDRHRTPPGKRRALLRREGRLQGAVRALVKTRPGIDRAANLFRQRYGREPGPR